MDHKELIEIIDSCIEGAAYGPYVWGFQALKSIALIHTPNDSETRCQAHEECWGCGEWGTSIDCPCNKYPCETIKAIQRALE